MSQLRTDLGRFWREAGGYWRRGGPRCAWPLTAVLGAVVLVSLGITYGLNLWNRHFFDALEARNADAALHQAMLFPLLVGLYLVLCVVAMAARMTLQRTWRAVLNDRLLDRWLARGRYYQLECIPGDHMNPEHRIHEDVRIATDMPVDFVTGFLTSALSAVSFFAVLWVVGGALSVPVAGTTVTIPGYLLIAALVYALVVNGGMVAIARGFTATAAHKNQAEAEYRFALTRVRENAESIALLSGAAAERAGLDRCFSAVLARWAALMGQHMRAVIVSQASAQAVGVVPVLLCTPRYLDGSMTLGQVMQVASAFTIVQGALSWLVDNFTRLGDWTASVRRVVTLATALDALEAAEQARAGRLRR
ncbi:ABC transporter ATP-binding protein/permease, partial [Rhodoplanes roseus]